MKTMSVSQRIDDLWRKIPANVKTGFFAALFAGLITHLVGVTNFFQNCDSVNAMADIANTRVVIGRWFQHVIQFAFGGTIDNPGTVLVMGIVSLAVSAALIIHLLSIRSVPLSALVGVLMVTFPAVFSTFSFTFAAVYFFALLLECLGVLLTRRGNRWIPLAVVMMALSMGIYQAYICCGAGLFIICLILDIFDGKRNMKQLLYEGFKYVVVLICSVALYLAITQILLKKSGAELAATAYNTGFLSDLPADLVRGYKKVLRFFWYDEYGENTFLSKWLYRGIILSCAGSYIVLLLKTKCYKSFPKLVLSAVLIMLLPLAVHVTSVLRAGANSHWLMMYAFVLIPILAISFIDRVEFYGIKPYKKPWNKLVYLLVGGGMLFSAAQGYLWFIVTGECYTAWRMENYAAYESASVLWDDILDAGWNKDMSIAFVGDRIAPFVAPDSVVIENYDKHQYSGLSNEFFIWDHFHMVAYLRMIMGRDVTPASAVQIEELNGQNEVISMPVYPEEGSIQIIDNVMVIKLSEFADG